MEPPDADSYRVALEKTISEADHLLQTFNALLSIAQAEAGAPRRNFADVDLSAGARDAAELYEPLAEEKDLHLAVEVAEGIRLQGDQHLLFQALVNLLDNAIKFSPAGGSIELSLPPARARALTVADRGPGIPESLRERALERFFRLEESRSTPGSGLGLSLVAAVARLHDGRIVLEDNQPGLRAVLDLPLNDKPPKPANSRSNRRPPSLNRRRASSRLPKQHREAHRRPEGRLAELGKGVGDILRPLLEMGQLEAPPERDGDDVRELVREPVVGPGAVVRVAVVVQATGLLDRSGLEIAVVQLRRVDGIAGLEHVQRRVLLVNQEQPTGPQEARRDRKKASRSGIQLSTPMVTSTRSKAAS